MRQWFFNVDSKRKIDGWYRVSLADLNDFVGLAPEKPLNLDTVSRPLLLTNVDISFRT